MSFDPQLRFENTTVQQFIDDPEFFECQLLTVSREQAELAASEVSADSLARYFRAHLREADYVF